MKNTVDRFVSELSVKRKLSLSIGLVVVPLFLLITLSLTILGIRLHDRLSHDMEDSRRSIGNAFSYFRQQTRTYAILISRHHDVRRGAQFTDTDMLLKYLRPLLRESSLDIITIHNRDAVIIARAHLPYSYNIDDPQNPAVLRALKGKTNWSLQPRKTDIILQTTAPIYHLTDPGLIVGAVTVGYKLNNRFALTLESFCGKDVLFIRDNAVIASSFAETLTYPHPLQTDGSLQLKNGARYDIINVESGDRQVRSVPFSIAVVLGDSQLKSTYTLIFIGICIFFLLIVAAAMRLALKIGGNITGSIQKILDSTREISSQNYRIDVRVDTADEFNTLAQTLNQMAGSINESFETIKNQNSEIGKLKNLLTNIIESMPAILIAVDDLGVVTLWNKAAVSFSGIPPEKAVGRILWYILPQFRKYREYQREVIKRRETLTFHREMIKGKEIQYYEVSLYPLIGHTGEGMVIHAENVTQLESKEDQLRQAQKMEVVGNLAGGLAHDFNNMLGGITGTISIIKLKLKSKTPLNTDELSELIDIIDQSAERSVEMVQQLLSLSRKSLFSFAPVDLNDCLRRVMKICQSTFDKSVELHPHFHQHNAVVHADANQLEQVLLNLCVNAAHAMTIMRGKNEVQGGRLTVSISPATVDPIFLQSHPEAENVDYWIVSVEDTGVGIDKNTAAKIFDPFFTTKTANKGSGLGLSMVYNILKQHKGFINLYSEPGNGSVFSFYLPVYRGKTQPKSLKTQNDIHYGSGLVLLVDDETVIMLMARKILTECGYDVITATNGTEGVAAFLKHHKEIKAVLLDMMMPKMSGKEAYLKMKQIDPNVKVLLVSGYKYNNQINELLQLGVCGFLQKPYSVEELTESIANIINACPNSTNNGTN